MAKNKNSTMLYGKNSIFERLKKNPQTIKKIFLQDNFNVAHIEQLIEKNSIPFERLSHQGLERIKHTKDLQGIVASVDKFQYVPFDDMLNSSKENQLTLLFLDRINDPHNLGVIIRTAACFGRLAIIVPKFEACEVNETVQHVASGGENYVPISMVTNLSDAIIDAKNYGYWIMGTLVTDDSKDINKVDFPFPLGIVLGSEGKGIRHGLQKHLDIKVRIPMNGAKLSFNVNIACAILCHEISKQRVDVNL